MDHFHYRDSGLHCEEVPVSRIAEAVGTPFYCYSAATLLRHLKAFQEAFSRREALICYSVKANGNLAILDLLVRHGAGLDIVSGGELERARRVGCPGGRVVFSGVGKSRREIDEALEYGVRLFNVESVPELHRLNDVARSRGVKAPISLRVNPDVDPRTHPHIATGLKRSKFGIPHEEAAEVYRLAKSLPHLDVVGLDCHIGSQLTKVAPFVEALQKVRTLLEQLERQGIALQVLDLGGGLGIPYVAGEITPMPAELAEAMERELEGLNHLLVVEPGRAIVGNAGILVARMEYVKVSGERHFFITDAGMNDLMRPVLYDAYHQVLPVTPVEGREEVVADVVGPVCESGDFFARDRLMPLMREGELLAVRSTGAYGFSMSSNYNSRPRAAEVLVQGDRFHVVRRRETLNDLLALEQPAPDILG
ncbi:MAG: diaminopimelate decarboxylase [Magnetococcales bacterium]|nr:diaminopimelate decarboxylase [Magnetococcales bacterium]